MAAVESVESTGDYSDIWAWAEGAWIVCLCGCAATDAVDSVDSCWTVECSVFRGYVGCGCPDETGYEVFDASVGRVERPWYKGRSRYVGRYAYSEELWGVAGGDD